MFTNLFGEPSQTDAPDYGTIEMIVPGFASGCLPLNTLLLSSLDCFNDQSCLDRLLTFFPTTETFTALTQTEDSRFQIDDTIQTIIDRLMVETWSTNVSFDQYFSQCAPVVCTYSAEARGDVSSIVSKLIRALGGLTVILDLIIPPLVRFIRKPRAAQSVPRKSFDTSIVQGKDAIVICFVFPWLFSEDKIATGEK